MPALTRELTHWLKGDMKAAKARLEDLDRGIPLLMEVETMREAVLLSENMMEFGAYVSVDQVGPISEEQFQNDLIGDLAEDLMGWMVVLDNEEAHIRKIIDPTQLAKIRFVSTGVTDAVGEEMMRRGAAPINKTIEADLESRMKAWREAWGQRIRAAIARKIALKKQEAQAQSSEIENNSPN